MEKEELLSLAGVVALLVAGDSDVSEDDGVSKLVSDGVVIPAERNPKWYIPAILLAAQPYTLSEIHPAMIIQVMSATEAAIEPMAIFFCRAFFFCAASSAVFREDNCFSYSSKRSELRAESFFLWRSFSISFSKSAMLFGF